jgi:hypothetical protein
MQASTNSLSSFVIQAEVLQAEKANTAGFPFFCTKEETQSHISPCSKGPCSHGRLTKSGHQTMKAEVGYILYDGWSRNSKHYAGVFACYMLANGTCKLLGCSNLMEHADDGGVNWTDFPATF